MASARWTDDQRDFPRLCLVLNMETPVKLKTSPVSVPSARRPPPREPRLGELKRACGAEHRPAVCGLLSLCLPFNPYTSHYWMQKADIPSRSLDAGDECASVFNLGIWELAARGGYL